MTQVVKYAVEVKVIKYLSSKIMELKKMRGEVHILVYCPIDTLHWGTTHSAMEGSTLARVTPTKSSPLIVTSESEVQIFN